MKNKKGWDNKELVSLVVVVLLVLPGILDGEPQLIAPLVFVVALTIAIVRLAAKIGKKRAEKQSGARSGYSAPQPPPAAGNHRPAPSRPRPAAPQPSRRQSAPVQPRPAAPAAQPVYSDRVQEENLRRDQQRRLTQLEGFLKNGIIDKAEYEKLKSRYEGRS